MKNNIYKTNQIVNKGKYKCVTCGLTIQMNDNETLPICLKCEGQTYKKSKE